MIVIPAIDLKDGKVVRLAQGKFDAVTQYSDDPVEVARHWEKEGAQWLHVVDLDGAKTGEITNSKTILRVRKAIKIPIQVGGGLRDEVAINYLLENSITRVVLGTKVIEDILDNGDFLQKILTKWDKKIAISLDCSGGFVATRGWVVNSSLIATDVAKQLESLGVKTIIYTDIAKDGMLSGPNIEGLKEILNAVKIDVIASGGISGLNDIQKLLDLKAKNLIGAITGKAIYEGKLNLKEAVFNCYLSS